MAMFGLPQGGELLIILAIVLLLFGPKQLPKLAKMVGRSARSLREGMEGKLDEDEELPPANAKKATAAKAEEPEEAPVEE